MKQEDLIKIFVNGSARNYKCSSLSLESEDNLNKLYSYNMLVATNDIEKEIITIMGYTNYHSATTNTHANKLKHYLFKEKINYIMNNNARFNEFTHF
tara:strand:- start:888 stop:1178 length:291 start_codon:yes stop_codon:yes gene_type:complete